MQDDFGISTSTNHVQNRLDEFAQVNCPSGRRANELPHVTRTLLWEEGEQLPNMKAESVTCAAEQHLQHAPLGTNQKICLFNTSEEQ